MKKLTTLAMVLLCGITFADVNLDDYPLVKEIREICATNSFYNNYYTHEILTEEQRAEYFTQIIQIVETAKESGENYTKYLYKPTICEIGLFGTAEQWAEIDTRWSTNNFVIFDLLYLSFIPKTIEWNFNEGPNSEQLKSNFTVSYSIKTNLLAKGETKLDIPSRLNIFAENLATGFINKNSITRTITSICKDIVPEIKMALRKQGKSFISKDDVNPVQDIIDRLTAALQAPRCAGLKEFVAEFYPDYTWIDFGFEPLTDEEVNALKDDVYYGQQDLTNLVSTKLLYYLGLDEYNAFIERYNQ